MGSEQKKRDSSNASTNTMPRAQVTNEVAPQTIGKWKCNMETFEKMFESNHLNKNSTWNKIKWKLVKQEENPKDYRTRFNRRQKEIRNLYKGMKNRVANMKPEDIQTQESRLEDKLRTCLTDKYFNMMLNLKEGQILTSDSLEEARS